MDTPAEAGKCPVAPAVTRSPSEPPDTPPADVRLLEGDGTGAAQVHQAAPQGVCQGRTGERHPRGQGAGQSRA